MVSMSRITPIAPLVLLAVAISSAPLAAQGGVIGRAIKKVKTQVSRSADSATDTLTSKGVNRATGAMVCVATNTACIAKAQQEGKPVAITDAQGRPVSSADSAQAVAAAGGGAGAGAGGAAAGPAALKIYQNYDFVPGDTIVFEDDFATDDNGEFPAHWKLVAGQGVVNTVVGKPAFALTVGNYARVAPRIKSDSYLGSSFTIEFDFNIPAGGSAPGLCLDYGSGEDAKIWFDEHPSTGGFDPGPNVNGSYPGAGDHGLEGQWHHAAVVFKKGQMKVYEDQYRIMVMPDVGKVQPHSVEFCGVADAAPLVFTNVRIANGGGMKLIDELTRDGRIITHGILFDVNKSVVKPQSMGTIGQILSMLKADPALKLEIDGHTDSDGDATANMTLSRARADAVKQVLVDQGIDASRLTTRGYGATKPIASNDTPEGKANNRRVEFVKQ
jgi:OmpA-OmpF porin, OOP family